MNPNNLFSAPEMQTEMRYIDSAGIERVVYRKIINTGALLNALNKVTAHQIAGIKLDGFIRMQLWASTGAKASTLTRDSQLEIDATNLTIVTAVNLSAYTGSQVLIEFTKG